MQQSVYNDIERIESQDETILSYQYVFENISKMTDNAKDDIVDEAQTQSQDSDQLLSVEKSANNSLLSDQNLSIGPEKASLSEAKFLYFGL